MKDLLKNFRNKAITRSDFREPLTNKRKEEHTVKDSLKSECRYTVGTNFNY